VIDAGHKVAGEVVVVVVVVDVDNDTSQNTPVNPD
jgi:hypothetical protein